MNRDEPAPEVLHEPGSSLAQDRDRPTLEELKSMSHIVSRTPSDDDLARFHGADPDPELYRDGIHPTPEQARAFAAKAAPLVEEAARADAQRRLDSGFLDEESKQLLEGMLASFKPVVAEALQEVLKPLRPNFETPAYDGPVAECQDGLKRAKAPRVRYDLMPTMAELEIVKALSMGAAKYDAGKEDTQGWQHPSRTHRMLYSAARRHLEARRHGELTDGEPGNLIPGQTGLHHLALAIVNLIFILEADLRGWTDKDNFDPLGLNRPKD